MLENHPGSRTQQTSETQVPEDEISCASLVGWIHEDQIYETSRLKERETGGQASLIDFPSALQPAHLQIVLNRSDVEGILFHEKATRCSTGEGFDTNGSRARKEIQEPGVPYPLAEDVEEGFADSIGCRAQLSPFGRNQREAASFPSNDSQVSHVHSPCRRSQGWTDPSGQHKKGSRDGQDVILPYTRILDSSGACS